MSTEDAKAQDGGSEASESTNPIIKKLKEEKQIEELKKDIATAKQNRLKAELPTSDTIPETGQVTIGDKAGYFATLEAYGTLRTAACRIASVLADGGNSKIILTDQTSLAKLKQMRELINTRLGDYDERMQDLLDRFDTMKQSPTGLTAQKEAAAGLAAAPAILGGLADIAAFFRVNTELKGREIELNKSALLAEIARALSRNNWNVVLADFDTQHSSSLLGTLEAIGAKRTTLAQRKRLDEDRMQPYLDDLKKKRDALKKASAALAKLEGASPRDEDAIRQARDSVASLEDAILPLAALEKAWTDLTGETDLVIGAFNEYYKALTEGTAEKPSPVETLAVVDLIDSAKGAHRLHIDIVSDGAEIHVTKSIWSSGRIHYLGGSVSSFFWFDGDGNYQNSGIIPLWERESFKASRGIENLTDAGGNPIADCGE